MDPNACLSELLELTEMTPPWAEEDQLRIQELISGLDQWLNRGGFPPAAWARR